jgi:DNA polymerase elongation subunit (family B)
MRLEKLPDCLRLKYDLDSIVYSDDESFFYNCNVSEDLIDDIKNKEFQVYTGYYTPLIPKWEKWKIKKVESVPTIYLLGRGKKSGKQKIKIQGFLPYCYVHDSNGEYETYLGDKVRKVIFECNPGAIAMFRKSFEENKSLHIPLEADIPYIRRFLCDTYPYFQPKDPIKPKVAIFDVETNFPVSDELISFSINIDNEIYHNSMYKTKDRTKLIKDLYNRLIECDIVTGWNVKFDVDILNNELKEIDKELYLNNEVGIIDLLSITKKMVGRQIRGSWSLENAGDKLVDVKKIDLDCYPRELDEKKLEKYNNQDVIVPYAIDKKYGALECHNILSWLTHCTIEDTQITSVINDISMLRAYHKAKKVLHSKPPWSDKPSDKESKYSAADPKARPGVYRNIMAFDVKHSYPWAVQAINATPETKDINGKYTSPNGIKFNDKASVFIDTLKSIMKERAKAKQKMKEYEGVDELLYKKYKFIDFALKTQAAAFSHGEFGYWRSRMKDYEVAEAITQISHDLIFYVMEKMDKLGYSWVYQHTDSIYIKAEKKYKDIIIDAVNSIVNEYCNDMGYKLPAELDYQEPYIKKAYIHSPARNVMVPEKVKIDDDENWLVTGMNFMRAETPDALRKIEINLIKLKLKNKNVITLIRYLKEAIKELGKLDSIDLGIIKPLNKPFEEYGGVNGDNKKIPVPYHIKALSDANDEYGFELEVGEKFMLLPILTDEVTGVRKLKRIRKYMAFPINDGLPKQYDIDFEYYLKSNLYGKVQKLFDIPEDILEECVRDYIPNISISDKIIENKKEEECQ